ncbi:glycosyltransferase family 2 protein [Allobaculum sp. JKK-2023]|uniref:glycosyltransferase family 2 protein n=1 Tax=Allobaculum sp. JKK-2023 TaxID=3108943 RepID=UPI002B05644F|nr:glycosyltransferase family 2 protein [Allobaculum sp. JKK-2023]
MEIVNAVVVTYNRKKLLEECINALLNQTYRVNKIIIIDNSSNDGTKELLASKFRKPQIKVISLKKNTGGAGGFYYGTKVALEGCDWIWEMDDDTIPSSNALEELLKAKDKIKTEVSFLASTVYGMNKEPMNVPKIDTRPSLNGYSEWYKYLKNGLIEIESATLVSLLFNAHAVKKVGAPHPFFFIWGDDTEYTLRMTHYYGKAYFVGKSEVVHKRVGGNSLSVTTAENVNRIKLYKMMYRNNLVCSKYYMSNKQHYKAIVMAIIDSFAALVNARNHRMLRFITVLSGVWEYLLGKYNKQAFDNRFNNINENYLDKYLDLT